MGAPTDLHRTPAAGRLLVASPRMLDPNFMHAVVLLCDHGPQGTFGLVLNRPLPLRVADLDADVPLLHGRSDTLWADGPVQKDQLQVLHVLDGAIEGALPVLDAVRFGGDPELLRAKLDAAPGAPVRFVIGYAGWGGGQLDAELEEGAWVVVPASEKRIFDPRPETLWRRLLRAEGGGIAELADVPPDPSWN